MNYLVEEQHSGERIDKFLVGVMDNVSRTDIQKLIAAGEVKVGGAAASKNFRVESGMVVVVEKVPEKEASTLEPEEIPLDIVYEDDDIVVLNKPRNLVVHPGNGVQNGTLAAGLLYHFKENLSAVNGPLRPGIVHRLDKETSGIIITAKNRDSEEFLQKQFKDKSLQKEYICICCGRPKERTGDIRTQIIRDPKNRHRFKAVTDTDEGKFARTLYHCIACYGNYSLMRIRLKTGRTHQIRVHMKYLGCPILGDATYNKPDSKFPNATLMLHSVQLKIKLPDGSFQTFRTPTPERFIEIEKKLRAKFPREILPTAKPTK